MVALCEVELCIGDQDVMHTRKYVSVMIIRQ